MAIGCGARRRGSGFHKRAKLSTPKLITMFFTRDGRRRSFAAVCRRAGGAGIQLSRGTELIAELLLLTSV